VSSAVTRVVVISLLVVEVFGSTTSAAQDSSSHAPYVARAQSGTQGQVRVSAAALSADESAAVYGSPLADKLIQPVWIQVENHDNVPYWLMFAGLDPNFFPASEAAEAMAVRSSPRKLAGLDRRFSELAFRNPVPPGGTVSGFVLTNLQEGVKLLQIDLFADRRSRSFSLLAPVPGLRTDYKKSGVFDRDYVAPGGSVVNFTSDAEFTAALESLPCCATNEDGSRNGDPLNLVIIGGIEDAFPSLVRRGWSPTEVTWKGSVMRIMRSAMSRERYPYAPISNLYLFDRPQDIALQKARDNIHQRNHLRLWRSPMLYHGKPVWVGQVSRDIGSRLTIHSPTFTTHKIDPDVDEAARALMEDLVYSQALRAIGLVKGVGAAPKSAPRENLTTDPYYTAGMRSVLLFDSTPTSLREIEVLPWQPFERGFLKPAIEIEGGE
jgi:LssY-like putative type I secretion system component LssY